jgi:hypothetical protein
MRKLSRDEILRIQDAKTIEVEVPEWGGTVTIKVMSGAEREQFEGFVQSRMKTDGKVTDLSDVRATLLSLVLVDDKGERMFSAADVKELSKKSSLVLTMLAAKAQEVNGLTGGSVEEMRKNS